GLGDASVPKAKFMVEVCPAITVWLCETVVYPFADAETDCVPAGTFASVYAPEASVLALRPAEVIVAPEIGAPLAASLTMPVRVPAPVGVGLGVWVGVAVGLGVGVGEGVGVGVGDGL